MTNLIDNICKLRDILENKQDSKIIFNHKIINSLIEELTRQATKKAKDYSYEIEFTSQDLRELAKDIRDTLKRWSDAVIPEKLIKKYGKGKTEIDLKEMNDTMNNYFNLIVNNVLPLTRLLCICEGHGAILYFMELDADDETAKLTERVI